MKSRMLVPELMDDPAIAPRCHEQALAGLARLNRWSRGDAAVWDVLRRMGTCRVLDLATGSGDLPIRLARHAARCGMPMSFVGCDISPRAIEIAQSQADRNGVDVKFFVLEVLRDPLPTDYDAIITSLFLHHLADGEAVELLRKMAASAKKLVVVLDLNRSRWNLGLVKAASRVLTRSAIVRHDGPASVRAAFTVPEARALATQAGLTNVEVRRWWPCRWRLTWRKLG